MLPQNRVVGKNAKVVGKNAKVVGNLFHLLGVCKGPSKMGQVLPVLLCLTGIDVVQQEI